MYFDPKAASIRTDAKYVYWNGYKLDFSQLNDTKPLFRCPLTGCVGSPEIVMEGMGPVFALDRGNLFWAGGYPYKGSGYSILMLPVP